MFYDSFFQIAYRNQVLKSNNDFLRANYCSISLKKACYQFKYGSRSHVLNWRLLFFSEKAQYE